jgi:hypothetical protein
MPSWRGQGQFHLCRPCSGFSNYFYDHHCRNVPVCSDMQLMKSSRVNVRNWSRCVLWILEKANSRHNESYKQRPSLKLQGLLFRLTLRVREGIKRTRLLLTVSKRMQWIGSSARGNASEVIKIFQ